MTIASVFNSPFELGIRMVFLLRALHPRKADLQRLVYLDYAVIYSADFGGPDSLHTPVPLRGGEYASRREIIEDGLYIMAIRSFVDVSATEAGILYGIGENGPSLTGLIGGEYAKALADRCEWVAAQFGEKDDGALETLFGVHGSLWGAQFIGVERAGAPE